MKINLAKHAGFCFGVKRAISIALETSQAGRKVHMLGDIVHNEDVARQIRKTGVKKITRLGRGKGKILLVRAHGAGIRLLEQATSKGYAIVDATCPMVKEIHRIVIGGECRGYKIIVIGDNKHDEVQGIIGHTKNGAIVIDSLQNIPWAKLIKIEKACVVAQSTQNMEKVSKIVGALKPCFRELKFFNTICRPTRIKQQEIKNMPAKNDVMVIIGSKNSANTRRLYEISKSLNKRTYWVGSKEELKSSWFRKAKTAGVTSGASTPEASTRGVIERIKKIT